METTLLSLALLVVAGGVALRWRHVNRATLSSQEIDELSEAMLEHWRSYAPGPDQTFGVPPSNWRDFGVTSVEAFHIARRLVHTGQIAPFDYGLFSLLAGEAPTRLALTRNAWERLAPTGSPITINGPTVFAGTQINNGPITYSDSDVRAMISDLAIAVREAADRVTDADLAENLATASACLAAEASEPQLGTADAGHVLAWLSGLASEATAGVISAGIVAAASGLLNLI